MAITDTTPDRFSHSLLRTLIGDDVARPLGTWQIQHARLGDASGAPIVFRFDLIGSYLYSLEGVHAFVGTATAQAARYLWLPGLFGVAGGFTEGLEFITGVGENVSRLAAPLRLPVSAYSTGDLAAARVELIFGVNTNVVTYQGQFWGYYWDRRAILTSSGLDHPR